VLNRLRASAERLLDYVDASRLPLRPNAVTLMSLAISALVPVASASSLPMLAALLVLASAVLDAVDGHIARRRGLQSAFGAFLDSTTDRVCDAIHTYALALAGIIEADVAYALAISEQLVSYARARAEGLGADLSGIGLMERGERVAAKVLALAAASWSRAVARTIVLATLLLSLLTVVQRVVAARRLLRGGRP